MLVGQGNCLFSVNKEEEKEEGEENKQQQEDELGTTMQSSVALHQICTRVPRQLFLSSEQGVAEE